MKIRRFEIDENRRYGLPVHPEARSVCKCLLGKVEAVIFCQLFYVVEIVRSPRFSCVRFIRPRISITMILFVGQSTWNTLCPPPVLPDPATLRKVDDERRGRARVRRGTVGLVPAGDALLSGSSKAPGSMLQSHVAPLR